MNQEFEIETRVYKKPHSSKFWNIHQLAEPFAQPPIYTLEKTKGEWCWWFYDGSHSPPSYTSHAISSQQLLGITLEPLKMKKAYYFWVFAVVNWFSVCFAIMK
jgi:hypothetical protein